MDGLTHLSDEFDTSNVLFITIFLDEGIDAFDIFMREKQKDWKNLQHYHLQPCAKKNILDALPLRKVPFVLVLNDAGLIEVMGNPHTFDIRAKLISLIMDRNCTDFESMLNMRF